MKPNFNSDLLEQAIVDIVTKENGRPIPAGIILAKYRKSKPKASFANDVIYHAIHQLIKKGIFKQTFKSKSIVLTENRTPKVNMSNLQEGKIAIISSGSGFITLDNQTKAQFFVHKSNLNGALNEDRVQFAQIEKYKQNDLLDATVTKVISHAKDFYVGIINIDSENHYTVKIDDDKFYLPIKLDNIQGLVNGQKILIKIVQFDKDSAHATISRIIGHVSDPGVDILSILYDNGVEPEFDDTVLNYARDIKLNIDDYQRKIRRDLTKLPIVTIDPATSKDFDDAIHVSKSDDKFVLTVSIADVSHYVKFKSVLDEVAQKRGCSIYLVDRVIPMLPHNLSDDICSLNPQVERLTLTCEMLINSNGKFEDIKVYPSIIKSHRRFSYDEVNAYFSKQVDFHDESLQVKQMIDDALTLHKILDKNKKDRGYIAFNIPEPIILVDKQGVPIEIKKRESGTAQKMIEDFMIAANEAVTIYAQKRNWPFIYRVHDKPLKERLELFSLEAKKLGFKITSKLSEIQPHTIAEWIKNNQDNPNLDLINTMLLRTMAKAEYSVNNIGHFGLASSHYTHFTSPIRRYPDLLVHRIYWMYEFNNQQNTNPNQQAATQLLDEQARISSKNELIAIKCERDVNSMKFAEYMSKHIGEEYEGYITTVSSYGIFVQLANTVEGLVKLGNLPSDFYNFNQKTNELKGQKKGLVFSLGIKVLVKVIAADKLTRKIEFALTKILNKR